MTTWIWLELPFHFVLLLNKQISSANNMHEITDIRGPLLQSLPYLSGREAGIFMVLESCMNEESTNSKELRPTSDHFKVKKEDGPVDLYHPTSPGFYI